ncbi:MAG: hypothetical protein IJJ00_06095 [Erysipelotrichaceae bacterium]|nr:hypothetical protein [Erysipelotrichaceae bacterium]
MNDVDGKEKPLVDIRGISKELFHNVTFKSFLAKTATVIFHVLLSALCGTILLTGVYSLPVERIKNNVGLSAYTMQWEGSYYVLSDHCTSQLDNYTDSIMLLEAAHNHQNSAIVDAMNAPRGYVEDNEDPSKTLVLHFIEKKDFAGSLNYPRYWHGYLVFLKPLLMLFVYRTIRFINGFLQFTIVAFTCLLLFKKGFKKYIIPYVLAYFMLMPIALAKSLQFSSCFYVFSLACIALLTANTDNLKKRSHMIFLYCGITTAFFDLLTYPVSTVGVPLVFYLVLADFDSLEQKLSDIIKNGLCWSLGFGGMWISKWIIGSIITKNNVILDAINATMFRVSSVAADGIQYNAFTSTIKNYADFFKTPITLIVAAYIIYLSYRCIKKDRSTANNCFRTILPYLLCGFIPAVWYALTINHSATHSWFTNKACVVSVLAIMFGLISLMTSFSRAKDRQ